MATKTKQTKSKPDTPDHEAIEELFERAVESTHGDEPETHYQQGVRDALGWVLGQYADEPEI